MSSRILNALFGPDVPLWACELTAERAIVVEAAGSRQSIVSSAASEIEAGALIPDLKSLNVVSAASVRKSLGTALEQAGFSGSDIVLVVPDDAVRVALIDVESFPQAEEEQDAFIRWKFKKVVPFDVGKARVTWEKVDSNGTIRLLAALTPEPVIRQYEEMAESFGLHAGLVTSSTLAATALIGDADADTLFVKAGASGVTTTVFVGGEIRFFRKVASQSLYEAAYPTFVYYQDKLEGRGLGRIVLCSPGVDADETAELEQGLGARTEPLLSPDIDDMLKPALGALQL